MNCSHRKKQQTEGLHKPIFTIWENSILKTFRPKTFCQTPVKCYFFISSHAPWDSLSSDLIVSVLYVKGPHKTGTHFTNKSDIQSVLRYLYKVLYSCKTGYKTLQNKPFLDFDTLKRQRWEMDAEWIWCNQTYLNISVNGLKLTKKVFFI